MKYYDSTMSTNMSKNVLATIATITSKEAITLSPELQIRRSTYAF